MRLRSRLSSRFVGGATFAVGLVLAAGLLPVGEPLRANGTIDVVAEGLDNARGIALGAEGRIYVAEAGRGGSTLVDVPLGDTAAPVCMGTSGAVTEIRRGVVTRLLWLPSYTASIAGACPGAGFAANGPVGIDAGGRGEVSVVIGFGGDLARRAIVEEAFDGGGLFGTAHRVLPNGRTLALGDPAALEDAANPDGGAIDSNPYGIAILPDGSRLVADAGADALFKLSPNGDQSVVATFTPICMPSPFGPIPNSPCPGGGFPAQPVPTSVALGPDGYYYVGLLGGFPFAPGTSVVHRIDPWSAGPARCSGLPAVPSWGCEVYASGLTSVVDIAFGNGGELYAVQFADGGVPAGFGGGPGSVQMVPPGGGAPAPVVEGLSTPGGVAVGVGALYVTNRSIVPGAGQVLRVALP